MDLSENLPRPPGSRPGQSGSVGGDGGNGSTRKSTPVKAQAGPSTSSASAKSLPKSLPKCLQVTRNGHYGTRGDPVNLECNHFKVSFKPREDVCHYNVTIDPVTKKGLSRKVMQKLYETFGQQFLNGKRYAYDGEKSLFTVGHLPFNSHEFPVLLDDDPSRGPRRNAGSPSGDEEARPAQRRRIGGRDFKVMIKYAATVNMGAITSVLEGKKTEQAQDALRVLDIMLREHATKRSYLLIRDSYFHDSLGPVIDIGEGVQAWRGYHVSFRPSSCGSLTLNFDLSTTTVIKPSTVLQFVQEHCKKDIRQFRDQDWQKAKRVLKGVLVETHAGRRQKILSFTQKGCNVLTFEKKVKDADGQLVRSEEVTVADYFQNERNIHLQHPTFPALDLGRATKPMYVPVELCKILSGQRYKKNLSGVQRKNHIDASRQGPNDRRSICKQAMDTNNYNADDLVKEFDVSIEPKMMVVKGRILDPPSLLFGNREEKPRDGRWNFNSKKMKNPSKIGKWAVANFGRLNGGQLAQQLKTVCASKGMEFGDVVICDEPSQMRRRGPEERVNDMIMRQMTPIEPVFVLAILPEKSSELYAPFKKICETKIGVVTQCIVPPRNVKDQYLTNVALKINLKWGGYNTVLLAEEREMLPKVSQVPTCIFGLDVSHGSPGDATSPSIAAAVGSMKWPNFSTYTTRVRAQPPKTEMIEGLYEEVGGKSGGMVMELLNDFFVTCRGPDIESRKPRQIVIYRDGVSESQFDQVLERELSAFKKGARGLEKNSDYNPKMTLIVVQKRHHTRFFPAGGKDNVKPGTIIDKDVCNPRDNDFFLCSHNGLIGTTRPTHYHVLYDEIGFTVDELQHLTHCLCYSYARCTTAVSVVAPAYYAHLAAQHCRNFVTSDNSGSESSMGAGRISVMPLPKINSKLNRRMFYT